MQQFIPGTEPPNHDPKIDRAIEDKYKRLAALKIAREAVSVSDAKLMELIEARGAPYPFTEPETGKRKVLRVDAKKRLKSGSAKPAKQEQADREWEAAQREGRGGDQQAEGAEAWEAEVKRRRTTVSVNGGPAVEIVDDDPFGATRSEMDETPAQTAVREAEESRAARRAKRAGAQ